MRKGDSIVKIAFWLLFATGTALFASVDGTVVNLTTGKAQPSVIVTLVKPAAQGVLQTLATVKTDAAGNFKIDKDLPPGPVLLQAIFKGVLYTQAVPPGTPTTGLHVKVYDATSEAGIEKVSQHVMLFEPSESSLTVSEVFRVENQSSTTFQDPVNGSIRFYAPESSGGKINVTISAPGGMPIQRPAVKTKDKDVYKIDYPVKPGESQFEVGYSLPSTDKFAGKILSGQGKTFLLTPSTVTLLGDGVEEQGREPQSQAHIYTTTNAASFSVRITGIGSLQNQDAAPAGDTDEPPLEEKAARVYSRMYWVLGLTLTILGLGGVLLYRRSAA
jgi:hypothetical protein